MPNVNTYSGSFITTNNSFKIKYYKNIKYSSLNIQINTPTRPSTWTRWEHTGRAARACHTAARRFGCKCSASCCARLALPCRGCGRPSRDRREVVRRCWCVSIFWGGRRGFWRACCPSGESFACFLAAVEPGCIQMRPAWIGWTDCSTSIRPGTREAHRRPCGINGMCVGWKRKRFVWGGSI